ncbi:MAG: cytochrome c [Alphaproteobacteria bacterium]
MPAPRTRRALAKRSTRRRLRSRQRQKLYEQHCAGCHGESSKPLSPDTPDLAQGEGLSKSDFEIIEILKSGSKTMPAYAAILTDDEILDVMIHVRSLPF